MLGTASEERQSSALGRMTKANGRFSNALGARESAIGALGLYIVACMLRPTINNFDSRYKGFRGYRYILGALCDTTNEESAICNHQLTVSKSVVGENCRTLQQWILRCSSFPMFSNARQGGTNVSNAIK